MSRELTKEASLELCECCQQRKFCRMFVLQNGQASWVCKECRKGNNGRES